MASIDGSTWKSAEPNFIYGVRCPYKDLSDYQSITLLPDQEGLLNSNNGIISHYFNGTTPIDHSLIPTARRFAGIPLGKVNPTNAEIWIINMRRPGGSKWSIDGLEVLDSKSSRIFPLKIEIQYSVDVINAKDFINYFIGTGGGSVSAIGVNEIHRDIFIKDTVRIREMLRKSIEKMGLMPQLGASRLDALTDGLVAWLLERLQKRGLKLRYLDISLIELDIDRLSPLKRESYLEYLGIHTPIIFSRDMKQSQQKQYEPFPMTKDESDGSGYRSLKPSEEPGVIYCAQCSKKHLTTEKFCPYCGNEYRPCPFCRSDNLKAAKRCVYCGAALKFTPPPSVCHNCGAKVVSGNAFCPNCGSPQKVESPDIKTCPRCKASMPSATKFCTKCGQKLY